MHFKLDVEVNPTGFDPILKNNSWLPGAGFISSNNHLRINFDNEREICKKKKIWVQKE